jgi:hypothetical protein
MAAVTWKFNTHTGDANYGKLRCLVEPRTVTSDGFVAFGVIAPNGEVLKTINPNFFATPATFADVTFPSGAAIESFVCNLKTDAGGAFMTGNYTLKIQFVFNGLYPGDDTTYTGNRTETYNFCRPNKGVLTAANNYATGQMVVRDLTDYTGLSTISRLITVSTLVPTTTTGFSLSVPIGDYQSSLVAKVVPSANASLASGSFVIDYFEYTSTINSPTDYSGYKNLVDKAKVLLSQYDEKECKFGKLSAYEECKRGMIVRALAVLTADIVLGYDISESAKTLQNAVK